MPKNKKNATVALLDVDGTLLFGSDNDLSYNEALMKALAKQGINNVYLFSSMSLTERSVKERTELINIMKKNGLVVEGVITDRDPGYHFKDKAGEIIEALSSNRKDESSSIENKIEEIISTENKEIAYNFPIGQAFKDAITTTISKEQDMVYGMITSALAERHQYKDAKDHKKAVMYELFMHEAKEKKYQTILFIDDAIINLKAVLHAHNKFFSDSPIKLLLVENAIKKMKSIEIYKKDLINGSSSQALMEVRGNPKFVTDQFTEADIASYEKLKPTTSSSSLNTVLSFFQKASLHKHTKIDAPAPEIQKTTKSLLGR